MAVALGLLAGLAGLAVATWLWAGANLFAPAATVSPAEWGALREAALAVKLAPLALATRLGREKDLELTLTPEELNHVLAEHLPAQFPDTEVSVAAADTATVISFSRRVKSGRYVNGEIRADLSGRDGEFEVKVFAVRTGKKTWPKSLHYPVSRWLEGLLERQVPVREQRYRVTGVRRQGGDLHFDLRVRPPEPAASP